MEDELFGEQRLFLMKALQHFIEPAPTATLIFARLRAHNKMQNAWQIGAKRTRRRGCEMSTIGP